MNEALQMAYIRGFLDGLREYAWWKDGEQQVGTCGTTLVEAIATAKLELAVDTDDTPTRGN